MRLLWGYEAFVFDAFVEIGVSCLLRVQTGTDLRRPFSLNAILNGLQTDYALPTRGTPRNDAFVIFKIATSLRKLLDWIMSERNSRISERQRAQEISDLVTFNVLPFLIEDNSKSDASSIAVPSANQRHCATGYPLL